MDAIVNLVRNKLKRKSENFNTNDQLEIKSLKFNASNCNVDMMIPNSNMCTQTDTVASLDYMDSVIKILSCNVCNELCREALQCKNGHLICWDCLSKIEEDGPSTCPVCRVNLKDSLTRSLVTEHLINELPERCQNCGDLMTKSLIKDHTIYNCTKRKVQCKYNFIGCTWYGPNDNLRFHENNCEFSNTTVKDCYNALQKYILEKIYFKSNGSLILKTLTDKLVDHNSVNMNLINISLSGNGKETLENEDKILLFSNKLFRNGFKIKFRIKLNEKKMTINYSLNNSRIIFGKYLFFLNSIKVNCERFLLYDKLRLSYFSTIEKWTNWYQIDFDMETSEKLYNSLSIIESRSLHIELIVINTNTLNESPKERTIPGLIDSDRWNNIMGRLRYNSTQLTSPSLDESYIYDRANNALDDVFDNLNVRDEIPMYEPPAAIEMDQMTNLENNAIGFFNTST